MQLLEWLVSIFEAHKILVSILGSFLIGEEYVLFASVMSGRGIIPIWEVILIGIIGMIILDSLWFLAARTKWATYILKFERRNSDAKERESFVETIGNKLAKTHPLTFLSLSKFIYGTRVISIIYASIRGEKFWNFVKYDLIAIGIWCAVMSPLGWIAGRGSTFLLEAAKSTEKVLALVLFLFAALYLLNLLVRYLAKKFVIRTN
jgi:membrane protein DedA with SNARE-associated domain